MERDVQATVAVRACRWHIHKTLVRDVAAGRKKARHIEAYDARRIRHAPWLQLTVEMTQQLASRIVSAGVDVVAALLVTGQSRVGCDPTVCRAYGRHLRDVCRPDESSIEVDQCFAGGR